MAQQNAPARFDFDSSFQEKLVRLLYQDEGFASAAIDYLKPDLFENAVHRWVVKKIQHCHNVLNHHATATVLQQERKKDLRLGIIRPAQKFAFKKFLAQRIIRPVPDKSYIKGEVNSFVKNQHIEQFVWWAASEGLPRQSWDEIDKRMMRVLEIDVTGDNTVGSFTGEGFEKRQKRRMSLRMDGLTTGLPSLDSLMLCQGLVPGQIGCVIGATGRGKTNRLIDIAAANVLEGVPTVYYTCELPQDQIEDRFDARFTGIPPKLLRRNPEDADEEWEKVEDAVTGNLVVKEYPMGTLTVNMIRAHLKRLERYGFYPKLIVIDYADVMMPTVTFTDSSYETQGRVYVELKGLAMEQKLIIWTGAQSNRAGMVSKTNEAGDIDISNISDSAKKAFIADVVLGLNQSRKEAEDLLMRIGLLKNRNGPADREIPVKVDHGTCRFTERSKGLIIRRKAEVVAQKDKKKLSDKHQDIQKKMKRAA
jgi:replicative DNA helicase